MTTTLIHMNEARTGIELRRTDIPLALVIFGVACFLAMNSRAQVIEGPQPSPTPHVEKQRVDDHSQPASTPDTDSSKNSVPGIEPSESAKAPPIADTTPKATPIPTPHPARGASKAAIKKYPELGKKDSAFNLMFLDMVGDRKNTDPAFLTTPDWPLKLADEVAKKLGVDPALTPTPPPVQAAASSPSNNTLANDPNNPLDKGAYNQHENPGYYDRHGRWHNYDNN